MPHGDFKKTVVNCTFMSPGDVKGFAEWLLTLERDDIVKEVFNGYEQRKEFKSANELYCEWYNNVRKRDDDKLYYAYSEIKE